MELTVVDVLTSSNDAYRAACRDVRVPPNNTL
jgi:hypothetical protein